MMRLTWFQSLSSAKSRSASLQSEQQTMALEAPDDAVGNASATCIAQALEPAVAGPAWGLGHGTGVCHWTQAWD